MITVSNLTKYYGEHAAISNLSFDIEKGEIVGFLGLNGAGKTTTLQILASLLLPTSGSATIAGLSVTENPLAVRRLIGFLPDKPPVYDDMTVHDYLEYAGRLRGVDHKAINTRVTKVEEQTDLREMTDTPIGSLSHGYKQRVGIAQALVHAPQLLILDEPASGLDPVQIVEMRALIKRLAGAHTVLISSHYLTEMSQTCDRMLVIQSGEIIAQGTEESLGNTLGMRSQTILTVRGDAKVAIRATQNISAVSTVSETTPADAGRGEVSLLIESESDVRAEIAKAIIDAELSLLKLDRSATQLENVFLQLTKAKSPGDNP